MFLTCCGRFVNTFFFLHTFLLQKCVEKLPIEHGSEVPNDYVLKETLPPQNQLSFEQVTFYLGRFLISRLRVNISFQISISILISKQTVSLFWNNDAAWKYSLTPKHYIHTAQLGYAQWDEILSRLVFSSIIKYFLEFESSKQAWKYDCCFRKVFSPIWTVICILWLVRIKVRSKFDCQVCPKSLDNFWQFLRFLKTS